MELPVPVPAGAGEQPGVRVLVVLRQQQLEDLEASAFQQDVPLENFETVEFHTVICGVRCQETNVVNFFCTLE